MRRLRWLLLLAPLAFGGCIIPMASVTPPLRVSTGAGGIIGSTNRPTDPPLAPLPFHFQMALMPLQVIPKLYSRRYDFGVGFQFYHENRHLAPIFAPHVEGSFVLWREPLNPNEDPRRRKEPGRKGWAFGLTRVSLTLQLQVPITDTSPRDVGFGTTLRVTGEFMSYVFGSSRGDCSSSRGGLFCAAGMAWGEISLGLYFEGTYMTMMGRHFGMISAGLTFRIPTTALVGVAMVTP